MKIAFVKPPLEVDAAWDPIRTTSHLGIWFMASLLKNLGHEVWYLDEVIRDGGLAKRSLSKRCLSGSQSIEEPLGITYAEFQNTKMADFNQLGVNEFTDKYSAFRNNGQITRTVARIGNNDQEILTRLGEINPDLVGIPLIATANYLPATQLARMIKTQLPQIKIVFGGQHISAAPEQFLKENHFVDQVVVGDAISVIQGIAEESTTDRIVYGGYQSMAKFPLLDPEFIIDTGLPVEPTYTYNTGGRISADFMFSKGCFRNCEFCVAGSQGNSVAVSDYSRLEAQLSLFKNAGIEEIVVQDDAFLWDKTHVQTHLPTILKLLKDKGFYWQNNGGIDFEGLSDFVADQFIGYNESGPGKCTSLYIPFNPRTWNKTVSSVHSMIGRYHENMENLKKLRQAGIYVYTSTIIGAPEQTLPLFHEELIAARKLIEGGYLDAALPLSATMLPGTKWYETNGHNIINKFDYPGYSLFTTHHRTKYLEPFEIEQMMIRWVQSLADIQKLYPWATGFPSQGLNNTPPFP